MTPEEHANAWVNGSILTWKRKLLHFVPQNEVDNITFCLPNVSSNDGTSLLSLERADAAGFNLTEIKGEFKYIKSIIIHGSVGSSESCDFSDIDILVVLNDYALPSDDDLKGAYSCLKSLLRDVYTYDPLMHHGLMFCKASDFTKYDEYYLPIDTLKFSKVIYGDTSFNYKCAVVDSSNARMRLKNTLLSLKKKSCINYALKNDYNLKYYISSILILPAFYLATKDIFVFKKYSFDILEEHVSRQSLDAIYGASEIRKNWTRSNSKYLTMPMSRFHPCLIVELSSHFQGGINTNINKNKVEKVINDFDTLANALLQV